MEKIQREYVELGVTAKLLSLFREVREVDILFPSVEEEIHRNILEHRFLLRQDYIRCKRNILL